MVDAGDRGGQMVLSYYFFTGFGMKVDESAGFRWCQKDAESGSAAAMSALVYLYCLSESRACNRDAAPSCYWRIGKTTMAGVLGISGQILDRYAAGAGK